MSDLQELYQSVILDHNRKPRNKGQPERFDATADGRNTLCGDACTVWVAMDGDVLADVRFDGQGCAISQASASLMTQAAQEKTVAEVEELAGRFRAMIHGDAAAAADESLGELRSLSGVARLPMRVQCAMMAWEALEAGLREAGRGNGET